MKKSNTTKNVTRKLLALLLAFALAVPSVMVSPVGTITAQAATYTLGNQSLSEVDGQVVLTAGGSTTTLTKIGVSQQVAFFGTASHPMVATLWAGNTLFVFCYDLNNSLAPVLIDNGVTSLVTSGEGANVIATGYVTSAGQKPLPTYEQLVAKVNGGNSNGGGNNNNNGGNNNGTTTVIGKPIVNGDLVTYYDGSKTYTLSYGKSIDWSVNDSAGTTWVRFANGQLSFWNYSLEKNNSTVTLHPYASNTNGLIVYNDLAVGYYDSKGVQKSLPTYEQVRSMLAGNSTQSSATYTAYLEGNTAYMQVKEGNYYNKIKVAVSTSIQLVGDDPIGSLYMYYEKDSGKDLFVWNYQLQKNETTKNLIKVSSSCTGLAFVDPTSNWIGYNKLDKKDKDMLK